MEENIDDLIKPVIKNGKLVTHEMIDSNLKVKNFKCSTYIEKEKILVKGQYKSFNRSRGALLVFFDLKSGKVKGILNLHF